MVYDYAKRPAPKPQKNLHTTLTGVVIVLAIALPVTMYYFKYRSMIQHKDKAPLASNVKANPSTKTRTPPAPNTQQEPQFDFYTVLPSTPAQTSQDDADRYSNSR